MKEEIAKKWVEYLRKPGLMQAESILGSAESSARCCLGHLCDIAVTEGVIPEPRKVNDRLLYHEQSFEMLPSIVRVWSGIETEDGAIEGVSDEEFEEDTIYHSLAELNDAGWSLRRIAHVIESKWKDI